MKSLTVDTDSVNLIVNEIFFDVDMNWSLVPFPVNLIFDDVKSLNKYRQKKLYYSNVNYGLKLDGRVKNSLKLFYKNLSDIVKEGKLQILIISNLFTRQVYEPVGFSNSLVEAVSRIVSLKRIDIINSNFEFGAVSLLDNIQRRKLRIKQVNFTNNRITSSIAELIEVYSDFSFSNISRLNLSRNQIGNYGAMKIISLCTASLEELILSNASIFHLSDPFGSALKKCNIRKLDLSKNHLNNRDVNIVVRNLPGSVTELNLESNSFDDLTIVSSLLKYSNLQSLNVKNNWFWKDSFDEFLESLEKSKITRLSITFDDLNDSEIVNFANAIEKSNVRFLDLRIAAMDQLPEIFKQIKDLKLIN